MAVLTGSELCLAYGDRLVLDSASLTIHEGERIGLIGRNGSGKTTLARVLTGDLAPDAGSITVRAGAEVAWLPQQPQFEEHATARDVVRSGLRAWTAADAAYKEVTRALTAGSGDVDALLARQADLASNIERLGGWDQDHRIEEITGHLHLHRLDDPVAEMSGGERRRIDLARVLIARPALAVLDEPTNHLDVDTIEWLEDYLEKEYGGALLLITHDRYVLDRLVTRTIELSRGTLHSYEGGWEAYLVAKAAREAHAARTEANRQNLLRRELDWLRRSPKARTTKSKSRVQRAEALIADAPAHAERDVSPLEVNVARSGKTAFELAGVSLVREDVTLIDHLDLIVRDGERIGIVGPNGIGKTTLLKVLTGRLKPTSGEVRIGANTRFAYFDQERSELDDERSVIENVCGNRDQVELGGRSMSVHSYLSRFLFDGDKQRQLVRSLSGGERARAQLAKFLLEPANVILLDEPTNDLDVSTLAALEELLVESGVTALFVTHDRYFLDRVAEAVLSFEGDGRVTRYQGSYQSYRRQRSQRAADSAAATSAAKNSASPRKSHRQPKPKSAGLTFTEAHELDGLMAVIDAAEAEVAELEAELADPDLYANRGTEVKGVQERAEAARDKLERHLARWEELESKRS